MVEAADNELKDISISESKKKKKKKNGSGLPLYLREYLHVLEVDILPH